MKCCEHDTNPKAEEEKHNPMKHMWMMILCCAVPVAVLLLLPFITAGIPGEAIPLSGIIPFLCPILMGIMMFWMFRKEKKPEAHTADCDMDNIGAEGIENGE